KLILKSFENFVNNYKISGRQFSVDDLGYHFMKTLKISDRFSAMAFAQSVINAAFEFSKIKEIKFISERSIGGDSKPKYIIYNDGDLFTSFILEGVMSTLKPHENYSKKKKLITTFHLRTKKGTIKKKRRTT